MVGIRRITVGEAFGELDRFRVIDVRERREFRGPLGYICGAENLALPEIEDTKRRLSLHEPLLIVSGSGERSRQVARRLAESCFTNVATLEGGMLAWSCGGLPVRRWLASSFEELCDEILDWFAAASALSREAVLPAFRWLLEARGGCSDDPTVSSIAGALDSLRQLARQGGSDPAELEASIRHFRRSLGAL